MSDLTTTAEARIEQVLACGHRLAAAQEAEALAVAARHECRVQLRDTLIGSTNPSTGKPYSATSALEAAEETETYRDHVRACATAVRRTQEAWAAYEVAKLRAQLAVRAAEVPV